ncbi:MAG: hypothetical protein OXK80_01835 [Bdellovibrionales bacterium]|nr:hypothetical protein [Bdellovibrionales bacterium]
MLENLFMSHRRNKIILYIIFLSFLLHVPAQARQKCNTFKITNYKFQLSADKEEQNNIISFHKVQTDRRSSSPIQKRHHLDVRDETGFLSAYVLTFYWIQQGGENKKTKQLKLVQQILKHVTKFKNRIEKIKIDLSKKKKKNSYQNDVNQLLSYINNILRELKAQNTNIEKLDEAFNSIITFSVDESKIQNGIGVYASVRKDGKSQWSQKKSIKELDILPPLFVSGKRKTKFLCNREAESIKVSVEFSEGSISSLLQTQEAG